MSTTVDERVVEMRFDNKQFESNVQTSMNTIEKLKQSLNMQGATKGLESVDRAAKKIDMSGVGNAVENVRVKFSAMEVVAITALTNVTNSAINAGKELVASLSIDQITAGWEKFASKTTSVATLISQGYDLDTVNKQLERLNWFTDETSYNFTDMVENISKFTASGKGLEESVTAIEGVANWAALSGQNANTASRAMYQLSQAMSAGYMRLEDYKSIQNASMDTAEFRQKCLDAAVALGTLNKNADGTYTTLNEKTFNLSQFTTNLTEGAWMTSDVMMKVFNDYSAAVDQIYEYADEKGITASQAIEELGGSIDEFGVKAFRAAQEARSWADVVDSVKDAVSTGWMNTFEIIFGNYEEAKELWTDLANAMYDVFAAGAEDRNAMLQEWKDLGGRTALVEAFWTAWENVGDILGTVKEAFREVFPPITAEKLYSITEGLKTLAEHLKLSDTASANLKSTFKGLFAILDIAKQAFSAIFTAIKPLFGGFGTLGEGILGFTGGLGNAIVAFDEFIKSSGVFQKVGEGIAIVIQTIMTVLFALKNKIKEKMESSSFELLHNLLERIQTRMSKIGDTAGEMKSRVGGAIDAIGQTLANCQFVKVLETIWNAVTKITGGVVKALGELGGAITKNLGEANFSGIIDLLNGLSLGAIALGITKFVNSFRNAIDDIGSFKDSIIGILNSVRGCFEAYQKQLQAGTLMKIAIAIGILAAALVALSLVDSNKLSVALGAITVLFVDLMQSMKSFNKISGKSSGVVKNIAAMIGIAAAVSILAGALKKIADLDFKQLTVGLVGVAAMSAMMVGVAKAMSTNSKAVIKGASQMILFAVAIKILASTCESLAQLEWDQLGKGLVGVGVLLAEISLFLRNAKFSGKSITTATGIVILAAAMKILASVCKDFGNMEWKEIGKGLTSIGILLAEITAFTKLTGNAKHVISTGIALIGIAAAMKIMASAVKDFSGMQWDEIGRGLTAMAGALAAITVSMNFMPKNMIGMGAGLITVSAALLIVANVLEKMGNFSWESIAKGLITLGGSMTILAIGLNAMTGTLAGSAALLVAAGALLVLTPALSILGAMSWESIVKGLVSIAGAFTIIGVAGAVLTPLIPAILGLSASLVLVGASVVAIGGGLALVGVGLSAIAVGLTALAAAGTAGATAIVASLTVIVTGVAALIPAIMVKIGEGIVEICKAITNSAGAIGEAFKTVVLTLVDALVECVPTIADGALKLITSVLESLVKQTPSIVDSIFKFLIEILEGVANNLPSLIQAVVDVIMAFFSGVVTALKGIDKETLLQGIVGVGLMSAIMAALSAVALLIPGAMVGVLGMGAVIAELALVLAAIGALAQIPGLNWLINEGGDLLQGIGNAIGKFIGGIAGGFMSGMSSQFSQIGTDLSDFMNNVQPFIEGVSKIQPSMMEGVKALAETILILTAADILQGLTSWVTGGSSLSKFGEELEPFGTAMRDFAVAIGDLDGNVVANAATAGKALAEMASTIPNTGGVVGFFAGENDMEAFGEQLEPFGKAMKNFGEAVDGLKSNAITEAAIAGKAMTEMASTIPNTGGLVSFFTGDNDMKAFGEQLEPFGKAIKEYGDAVYGLKTNAIADSATAGKALIELANTVPNTGGLVSWFTGDNDLATFGSHLVDFGKAMQDYSTAITDIDSEAISNSTIAGKALVELGNTLPNTGGLVSWFTGDNDLGTFGNSLIEFGKGIKGYSESLNGVDTGVMASVITQVNRLVDMAKGMTDLDTSGMSGFSTALGTLGETGITEFINAFENSETKVIQAGSNLINRFLEGINKVNPQLQDAGYKLMVDFINKLASAMDSNISLLKPSIERLVSEIISGISNGLRAGVDDCQDAGKFMMQGFGKGIESEFSYIVECAKNTVSGAVDAIKDFLGIHSPSKLMAELGEYSGEGYEEGLLSTESDIEDAGESVAEAAYSGMDEIGKKLTEEEKKSLLERSEHWNNLIKIVDEGVSQKNSLETQSVQDTQQINAQNAQLSKERIQQEEAYWVNLLAEKKKGAEAEKYQSMNIVEFRKSIVEQSIDILKNYTDTLKSTTESMMNDSDMFTDVVTSRDLINRLSEQISEIEEYKNVIASLNERIPDGGLKEAISEMGVDSLEELKLINGMTDAELTNYVQLYEQKYAACQEAASVKLSGLQTETEAQLSALYGGVQVKLDTFAQSFNGTFESIRNYVGESISIGSNIASGVADGIAQNTQGAKDAAEKLIKDTEDAAKVAADIQSPSGLFRDNVGTYITQGVAEGMIDENAKASLRTSVNTIIDEVVQAFDDSETKSKFNQIGTDVSDELRSYTNYEKFRSAGAYLVEGFANGISENTWKAEATARAMARAAAEAAEDELDEASPSKVGYRIGDFFGMGFVNAIDTYEDTAYDASANMAKSARIGLDNAIQKMNVSLGSIDDQPTIRPVLDLSDVETKSRRLNSLFSRTQALSISTGIQTEKDRKLQNEDSNKPLSNSYNFTQNNYSPKALSRTEIYRQTKNQFSAMERMATV